jgi:GNAT superfamily N-acetyltransferase
MIRQLQDDDFAAVASIHLRLRPDGIYSERSIRHTIETMPPRARGGAWVADQGGTIVGWAFAHRRWWRATDSAYAWAGVLPELRGRGIGGELWQACAEHVATLGVDRVYSDDVDDPAGRRFLQDRGFAADRLDRVSVVDPRTVDLGELTRREAQAHEHGYRVDSVEDVELFDLYRLDLETSDDTPGGDSPHQLSFAEWQNEVVGDPDFSAEGSAVVLLGDHVVAAARLASDVAVRRARNEGTGTARTHRGRGLATLAKLATIHWAAANGIETIVTDNADANAPMLAINRRLGYREIATRRRWVRQRAAAE